MRKDNELFKERLKKERSTKVIIMAYGVAVLSLAATIGLVACSILMPHFK